MGDHTWLLETINITGASRLADRLGETEAHIVMVQEHRAVGPRLDELQGQAKKKGWTSLFSPAHRLADTGGLSGGTAVLARKGIGLGQLGSFPAEIDWPCGHRLSLCFANIAGGIVLGSVYMTTGIGLVGDNASYLERLGEVLVSIKRPFALGGRLQPCKRCSGTGRVAPCSWGSGSWTTTWRSHMPDKHSRIGH